MTTDERAEPYTHKLPWWMQMPDNCNKCIHFGNSSGKCRHPKWPLKRLKQDHNIYESRAKCCPFKEHTPQHIGNCVNACAGLGADPAAGRSR